MESGVVMDLARLTDPASQDPLPLMGNWVADNNWGYYGYTIFDSNMATHGGSNTKTETESWNNYAGRLYTYGAFNSGSAGSTYWLSATPNTQAEGNYLVNLPASGQFGATMRNYDATLGYWPFYGTHIGEEGVRQRVSLYLNGNVIRVHNRGSLSCYEQIGADWFKNAIGEPGANGYGTISYNDRTRQLIIIQGTNNSYRLHSWTNRGRSLNERSYKTGTIYKFMQEARNGTNGASYFYNDFTWGTTGSNTSNEDRYHFRVIAGDNGVVGLVRMTPNNQTIHSYITPNPSGTTLSVAPTAVSTLALTTSYGIDSGNAYGIRSNITWDNKWIACYSAYYYYGAGINSHYVSVANPSIGYVWQWGGTNMGVQVLPFKENKFIVRLSAWNNDGNEAVRLGLLDPSSVQTGNGGGLPFPEQAGVIDNFAPNTGYSVLTSITSWNGGSR